MEKYINKEDIESSVEEIIYKNLKELGQNENHIIKQKMKELENMYNQFAKQEEVESIKQFHDTTRFNTSRIDETLFTQYKSLKGREIDKIGRAKIIDDMYNKILEIINILKEETNINYAIYFDSGGRIYRSYIDSIPSKMLKLDNTKNSVKHQMQIQASNFKKWATVKSQKRAVDVTDHFNAFIATLQDTYNGKPQLPNKKVNKGHIAEAFERHLQNMHNSLIYSNNEELSSTYDWTVDEAWKLVRASLGNDPWYTGGDVGNIQVKSLFAGDRTVTSYATIEDTFNFLEYLLKENESDDVLRRKASEAFSVLYNKVDNVINESMEMTVQEIVDDIFGKS